MAGGGMKELGAIHVRATEHTVGDNGDLAMPADLPPASAYTYAVDLSADEAGSVTFNQPVPFYVENFIGFPVGAPIPAAYFDSTKGQWIPSQSGQVIAILSMSGGLADLDLDGSGTAAPAMALAKLGISDDERRNLAT